MGIAANDHMQASADALNALGLFNGTGTDAQGKPIYELDRAPTRYEAVTMLVRLLGKEAEAKAGKWNTPFTDLVAWAEPYVGYAYTMGLTNGTGSTTFSGKDTVTATQYLTFVLRALGYDSSKDFKWNAAWELSDSLGLTNGEYNAANNGNFLRGNVALISHSALDINLKDSSTPLRDTIPGIKENFSVDYSGDIPAATGAARLSAQELKALSGLSPESAAAKISTLADAYAWLRREEYCTTGMSGINGIQNGIVNGTRNKEASWLEMSAILGVLLEGDYDEVGTYLCASMSLDSEWPYDYMSFNYVRSGGVYYITDPLCHLENSGWACCRAYTIQAGSLQAIKAALEEINDDFKPITLAVYPLNTEDVKVDFNADPLHITFPSLTGIEYLFHANAKDFEDYEKEEEANREEEMKQWEKQACSIKISNYNIPAAIGKLSINYDQALALVGKDPAVIAEALDSVADVLQYMIAARFGYYSDFFGTPWYDGWGFDAPGYDQIAQNYGCCCGGYANAVNFLLEGDFEKQGTLRWVGGGNHTINWVYTGGKYYVFDFTAYSCLGNYNSYDCPVTVLDRLEDFYDHMGDSYSGYPKDEVVLMVAFETAQAMYPSGWNDPPHFTGLTFPKEAEGKITVIYQRDPRYGVLYKNVNTAIPGWNN